MGCWLLAVVVKICNLLFKQKFFKNLVILYTYCACLCGKIWCMVAHHLKRNIFSAAHIPKLILKTEQFHVEMLNAPDGDKLSSGNFIAIYLPCGIPASFANSPHVFPPPMCCALSLCHRNFSSFCSWSEDDHVYKLDTSHRSCPNVQGQPQIKRCLVEEHYQYLFQASFIKCYS